MTYWVKSAADRRTIRRAVELPCQVVAEDGFRFLGERTMDVSADGLLLRSDEPVRIGEPALVALKTPLGGHWIDAEAVVARIVRGFRTGDRGAAIGLRFIGMDSVDRAILMGSLRGLPPPLPQRRRRRDYASSVADIAAKDYAARISEIADTALDDELIIVAA